MRKETRHAGWIRMRPRRWRFNRVQPRSTRQGGGRGSPGRLSLSGLWIRAAARAGCPLRKHGLPCVRRRDGKSVVERKGEGNAGWRRDWTERNGSIDRQGTGFLRPSGCAGCSRRIPAARVGLSQWMGGGSGRVCGRGRSRWIGRVHRRGGETHALGTGRHAEEGSR